MFLINNYILPEAFPFLWFKNCHCLQAIHKCLTIRIQCTCTLDHFSNNLVVSSDDFKGLSWRVVDYHYNMHKSLDDFDFLLICMKKITHFLIFTCTVRNFRISFPSTSCDIIMHNDNIWLHQGVLLPVNLFLKTLLCGPFVLQNMFFWNEFV